MSDYESNGKKCGLYHYINDDMANIYEYIPSNSHPDLFPTNVNIKFWDVQFEPVFNNCFKNPFIYEYTFGEMPNYEEEYCEIVNNNLFDEALKQKLEKLNSRNYAWTDRNFYDFLCQTLEIGEFVELYTAWLTGSNYVFDPPTIEHSISLDEVIGMSDALSLQNDVNLKERFVSRITR